jgi:hypothetical protein
MLSAVTLSPDSSLILTNITLPVAFVAFSVPSVNVNSCPEYVVLSMTLSPELNAQPLDPFPPLPVSAPGTPDPPYVVEQSNQPFNVLALSIAVPGAAMNMPDTLPDMVKLKLAIVVLLKANV